MVLVEISLKITELWQSGLKCFIIIHHFRYLQFFYLPLTKFSYYAGLLSYENTAQALKLKRQYRDFIAKNTATENGSSIDFSLFRNQIKAINFTSVFGGDDSIVPDTDQNPCDKLLYTEDSVDAVQTNIIIPLPKIAIDRKKKLLPTEFQLPFKSKQYFDFNDQKSKLILTAYYMQTIKCYRFRSQSEEIFQNNFYQWLVKYIEPLLNSPKLYPGLGAVLRIIQTMKEYGVEMKRTHGDDDEYEVDDDYDDVAQKSKKFNKIENQINKMAASRQLGLFERLFYPTNSRSDKHLTYAMIAVGLILVLLLFVICTAVFMTKQRKKKLTKDNEFARSSKSDDSNRKWFSKWCCWRKKKPNRKENVEIIGPNSSSVYTNNQPYEHDFGI